MLGTGLVGQLSLTGTHFTKLLILALGHWPSAQAVPQYGEGGLLSHFRNELLLRSNFVTKMRK